MIDLHTHTFYSDGQDDVITLLKKAEEQNLEYLSITDHDTCKAYKEIANIQLEDYYQGKLITGGEFTTTVNGVVIELLGYKIDTEYIQEKINLLYKYTHLDKKQQQTERFYKLCKDMGMHLSQNLIEKYDNTREYATEYILRDLHKDSYNTKFFDNEKQWNDYIYLYREYMSNPNTKFYISEEDLYPTVNEVIKMIKEANGLVFVPHIFEYGENSLPILKKLTNEYKVDGFECFYPAFSESQQKRIIEHCKENNLLMSGGSDYHGKTGYRGYKIGKGDNNLEISKEIIEKWI